MSYDYSENVLVQNSAGNLLRDELGWDVVYAYNTEVLGENGTLGRRDYREIVLWRDVRAALERLNPWITPAQIRRQRKHWSGTCPRLPSCRSMRKNTLSSATACR